MMNHFGRDWIPLLEVKVNLNDKLFGDIFDLSYRLDKYLIKYYKADDLSDKVENITKALLLMHPLRTNLQMFIKKRGAKPVQEEEFTLMMNAVAGAINEYQINMTKVKLNRDGELYEADYTNVAQPICQMLSFMNAVSMGILEKRDQTSLWLIKDMLPVPLSVQTTMAQMEELKSKAKVNYETAERTKILAKIELKNYREGIQPQSSQSETSQQPQKVLTVGSGSPFDFMSNQIAPQSQAETSFEEEKPAEKPKDKKEQRFNIKDPQFYIDKLMMNGCVDRLHYRTVTEIATYFSKSIGRTSEILKGLLEMKKVQREQIGRNTYYWVSEVV